MNHIITTPYKSFENLVNTNFLELLLLGGFEVNDEKWRKNC